MTDLVRQIGRGGQTASPQYVLKPMLPNTTTLKESRDVSAYLPSRPGLR